MFEVLLRLIVLVKPLIPVMMCTITAGVLGFLCAIFITILGFSGILNLMGLQDRFSFKFSIVTIIICAISRSILRYIEQSTGHFIAFKLLAIIRDKVFKALRRLSPAKLEVKDKGNLISIITSDIELLEVFYAHTIAPIAIAIITSLIMTIFISQFNVILGLIALSAYIVIGFIVPLIASRANQQKGRDFRNEFGDMNSYILDNLRGLRETIQYRNGNERLNTMIKMIDHLSSNERILKIQNGITQGATDAIILVYSIVMIVAGISLQNEANGNITFTGILISTVSLMSSFGPVAALSALSGNLNQTIASGERVLAILDEHPQVEEVSDGYDIDLGYPIAKIKVDNEEIKEEKDDSSKIVKDSNNNSCCANVDHVTFTYNDEEIILKDFSIKIEKNELIGIAGKSGSGKSTLLKLLMRFWDINNGSIKIDGREIRNINTISLRQNESYVTQETALFNDTIEENIKIGNMNATHEQVVEAAKKASMHDFISSLPDGYNTKVGELGDHLSGGEKQRIGLARAFLHNANFILLDEPTSNLDSLNEAIILKSINEERKNKTIVLVSHRESTIKAADRIFLVENGRLS